MALATHRAIPSANGADDVAEIYGQGGEIGAKMKSKDTAVRVMRHSWLNLQCAVQIAKKSKQRWLLCLKRVCRYGPPS
jgi:hypothetical protein